MSICMQRQLVKGPVGSFAKMSFNKKVRLARKQVRRGADRNTTRWFNSYGEIKISSNTQLCPKFVRVIKNRVKLCLC